MQDDPQQAMAPGTCSGAAATTACNTRSTLAGWRGTALSSCRLHMVVAPVSMLAARGGFLRCFLYCVCWGSIRALLLSIVRQPLLLLLLFLLLLMFAWWR